MSAIRSRTCATLAQQVRLIIAVDAIVEIVTERLVVDASSVAATKRVLRAQLRFAHLRLVLIGRTVAKLIAD